VELKIINLHKKAPLPKEKLYQALMLLLEKEAKPAPQTLNLVFVNDQKIKALNKRFLRHNYPTDVLAFCLGQKAEVVISVDTAIRQAKIFHTHLDYELCLYALHGLLHLLGYHDQTQKARANMQKKAEAVLKKIFLNKGG